VISIPYMEVVGWEGGTQADTYLRGSRLNFFGQDKQGLTIAPQQVLPVALWGVVLQNFGYSMMTNVMFYLYHGCSRIERTSPHEWMGWSLGNAHNFRVISRSNMGEVFPDVSELHKGIECIPTYHAVPKSNTYEELGPGRVLLPRCIRLFLEI
jgi:hypothetical protein